MSDTDSHILEPVEHAPGERPRTGLLRQARDGATHVARDIGAIRIPDFVLFFLMATAGGMTGLPFQPTALALGAAVAYASFLRPRFRLGTMGWWIPITALALLYVGVVSLLTPESPGAASWEGRLLRLSVMFVFLFFLASGRLDLHSGILGYATALIINVPLFYAGVVPDTYGGYLTGWLGDKNVAGMAYCLIGLMMLWGRRTVLSRSLVFLGFGVPLWLTGSRTAITAYVAAAAWIIIAPFLPVIGRWLLGVAIYAGVALLATTFAQVGVFQDRVGSDALRGRIDAASLEKLQETGFFGQGLGEAFVNLGIDGDWYFHNSYWSALVEGGWPWLLFLIAMTVVVMIQPFTFRATRDQFIGQGAGIAVLICASQLGEVFGTIPWAIAVAFAMQMYLRGGLAPHPSSTIAWCDRRAAP